MSVKATTYYTKFCNDRSQKEVKMLYVAALDAYDVHWMGEVAGASDALVLYFVIKRTIKFGKLDVAIPLRHFREGVKTQETGEIVVSGLPLTHETVTAALGRLKDRGLVTFERKKEGRAYEMTRISLLLDAVLAPVTIEIGEDDVGKLSIPRSKKYARDSENGDERGVRKSAEGCAEIRMRKQHNVNNVNKIKNQTLSAADAAENVGRKSFDTAVEAIATSNLRIRRSREVKAASAAAAPGAPKLNEFRALWQQHMLQHWPTVPVVSATQAEWGMFKRALASVENTVPLSELVEYAIAGWSSIINIDLHWMKDVKSNTVGLAPDMVFFIRHVKHFMKSIAKHKATNDSNLKRVQVSPEKKQEDENADLRRQLAKVTAENRRLAEKARSDERIMQEMDRKKDAPPASIRQPLTRAQLRPVEDDDNLPRKWNGQ
jgi:DNA-binding transcriptional ArsR family regulator